MIVDALLLVGAAAVVAGLARRLGASPPLVLVVAGLALSFLPGVPTYELEPEVVLYLFLPPLLFAAAWQSSVVSFRQNIRAIGLLSVGLVLFSTLAVGYAVHLVVPELPLAAAFALGAIVSPPDAVAATAVGREVGLPRRLMRILSGESLVNDATALTAYRVAVGAATAGGFSLWHGVGEFVVAGLGGAAIGLVLGVVAGELLARTRDSVLENALLLLVPFVGFAVAEELHTSGVLGVVVAGLYLGHSAPGRQTAATRLQGTEVWRIIEFLLESIVFALIGLQLVTVVKELSDLSAGVVVAASAVALGATVAARFVWIYPATYLPRLIPRIAARDGSPPWQYPTVLAWAGMRGVVSLAAAIALPGDFPQRGLIVFLTFVVVIGTLLLQGPTLPLLIRRLGVVSQEAREDLVKEAGAQHAAATAALQRLESALGRDHGVPTDIVARLREQVELRKLGAWERLGGDSGAAGNGDGGGRLAETPTAAYRRLRREMLDAERQVFRQMRDSGRIDDEVLERVQRELDLEESSLMRD